MHPPLHKAEVARPFLFLGSEYGGWPLLLEESNDKTVIFSFGIGEDISFDIEAIQHFGCRVWGFDPTPRSQEWILAQNLPETFKFIPVGLSGSDGSEEFHEPAVDAHVSYSITPKFGYGAGVTLSMPVLRLDTLISCYNLPKPDVIKMDIEGFEYREISDILRSGARPIQFLIEFHHEVYESINTEDTRTTVDELRNSGYKIFFVSASGREYGFVWDP